MMTGTYELLYSIPGRIGEIQLLLARASEAKDKDSSFYDALCRASAVLLAAHLEAFLKELSNHIISDLNYHLQDFSSMPTVLKREFCLKIAFYEGVEKREIDRRVSQLMRFFDTNSVKIDLSAFPYLQNPNKNPSADVIQASLEKIGVPNVLHSISGDSFTSVFDGNARSDWLLKRNLRRLVSTVYKFPYRCASNEFVFDRSKPAKGQTTLWHEFVETVMTRRHSIVHGDTLENGSSDTELSHDAEKLLVLMYAMSFSVTSWYAKSS